MESLDVIKILNSCKGYDVAFLSTYTCDIDFINRIIITSLLDQGCKKIVLFTDRRNLMEKLTAENHNTIFNNQYIINPIKTHCAFHPKVFLLLGKDKARLLVGSGNLTYAGMLKNNEVFANFEYSEGSENHLNLIQKAFSMFIKLSETNYYPLQNKVFEATLPFKYLTSSTKENQSLIWLDNTEEPIAEQLLRFLKDKIITFDVIVPYFDSKCEALGKLKTKINAGSCRIFVQNGKSNLKPDRASSIGEVYCFDEFNKKNNFYHAKVFVFYGIKNDYVLYGSANCSTQALFETSQSGNHEACIFEKGNKGKFNYYLDYIDDFAKLNKETYTYIENSENSNFTNTFFEYALLNTEGLTIVLKQTNSIALNEIRINGKSQCFSKNHKEITIIIENPEELVKKGTVFEINIHEEERSEYNLAGWYLDEQLIMYTHENREEILKQRVLTGQWEDLSTILEIIREFQEKPCWDYTALSQSPEYIKKKQETEIETNDKLNDNPDDYIVDDPTGDTAAFNNSRSSFSLIHIFYTNGMARYKNPVSGHQFVGEKDNYKENNQGSIETEYTDYDKRWLNRQLRALLKTYYQSLEDEQYIKEVDWNSFWEKNIAIMEFVYKLLTSVAYNHLQNMSDMKMPLSMLELVKMHDALITSVLKYKKTEIKTEEQKTALISMNMFAILWLYYNDNEEYKNKLQSKKSFDSLRQLVMDDSWLRDKYLLLLPLLKKAYFNELLYDEKDIVNCFEKLFDYHTINSAKKRLKTLFGPSFYISSQDNLEVKIQFGNSEIILSSNLKEQMREAIIILSQIKRNNKSGSIILSCTSNSGNIHGYNIKYLPNSGTIYENINYMNGKALSFDHDKIKYLNKH